MKYQLFKFQIVESSRKIKNVLPIYGIF